MLKNLVKVANRLDSLGLTKEADAVDKFIRKMASDLEYGEVDEFNNPEDLQTPTMYWGEMNVYNGPLVSKEVGEILDRKFRASGGKRTRQELFEQLMELGWNGETDPDKSNWPLNTPIKKMAGGHGDPGNWSESEWEEWESEAGTFPKMDASEEGMSLGNLGFSSLDSAGVDTDHVYAAIDEMRNPAGSYSMNNSSYLVVPHNYPKLEVMIYLNQPGRETRTYSGHRQRDLGDSISDFLVSNGYKSTELPVPGSEKLGY